MFNVTPPDSPGQARGRASLSSPTGGRGPSAPRTRRRIRAIASALLSPPRSSRSSSSAAQTMSRWWSSGQKRCWLAPRVRGA